VLPRRQIAQPEACGGRLSSAQCTKDSRRRSHVPITFRCACGKTLEIADEHAGKRGRCPECGAVLEIPRPEERVMEAMIVEAAERPREEYAEVVTAEEAVEPAPPADRPGPVAPQRLED